MYNALFSLLILGAPLAALAAPTTENGDHREVTQPAAPGAWVSITEQRWSIAPDNEEVVIPRVAATDARVHADLARLNDSLQSACLGGASVDEVRKSGAITGCSFVVDVNRGPWLAITVTNASNGAYPSVNAAQVRVRLDSGKSWALVDGVKRAKLRKVCDARLKIALAEKRREWAGEPAVLEEWLGSVRPPLSRGCPADWLERQDFSVDAQGNLVVTQEFPHVARALGFDVVLPRDALADAIIKDGPFAAGR